VQVEPVVEQVHTEEITMEMTMNHGAILAANKHQQPAQAVVEEGEHEEMTMVIHTVCCMTMAIHIVSCMTMITTHIV
jgi:hypothetical protein